MRKPPDRWHQKISSTVNAVTITYGNRTNPSYPFIVVYEVYDPLGA